MDAAKETITSTTIGIDGLQVRDAGKLVRSKRSGGPRTAAGKLLSAKNSLKTGAYSNLPVLPGESQKDYLELENYLIKEYNPQTLTDGMMVSDLAKNVWKKLRLDRIETSHFMSALSAPIERREYDEVSFWYPHWAEDYLEEVDNIDSYDLDEKRALCRITKKWLSEFPTQDEFDAELLKNPALLTLLQRKAELNGLHPPTPERMYHKTTRIEYHQEERMLPGILQEINQEIGPLVWVLNNRSEILEARQRVNDARLRNAMHRLGLNRQMDDVNRRIFKLRDELYKAQDRRMALAKTVSKASPKLVGAK